MATELQLNSPLAPPLPLRRFSVEQYHRLGELGVLTPDDNVELLEGWIVEKMNQRPIHGFIVGLLAEIFQSALPGSHCLRCQLPLATERSEPEPDITIVRGSHTDFRDRHPLGTDCCLVVEVADTSLDRDRSKAAIYREAGVPEYWIVNVADKRIERFDFTAVQADLQPELFPANSQLVFSREDVVIELELNRVFE